MLACLFACLIDCLLACLLACLSMFFLTFRQVSCEGGLAHSAQTWPNPEVKALLALLVRHPPWNAGGPWDLQEEGKLIQNDQSSQIRNRFVWQVIFGFSMNLFSDVKAVKSMMLVPLDQHLLETDSMGKVPTHLLIEVGICYNKILTRPSVQQCQAHGLVFCPWLGSG